MKTVVMFLVLATVAIGQPTVKARLEKSPRHLEWIKVKSGNREVACFIAYPEVKDKAPAVVVIHEIFGLSDWARSVTDSWPSTATSPSPPICSPAWRRVGEGRRSSVAATPSPKP